jgi:hypothetical protein
MLQGITICVVPLLGLGSDQQEKCNVALIAVESYYLDKFFGSHAKLLMCHLRFYTREGKTSILLFFSPQLKRKGTKLLLNTTCI